MINKGIDMYYVYLHKRKGTNKVFYVGKGTKSKSGINRIESDKNRNIHWQRVVEKDGGYDYEIYKDDLEEQEAFELETQLINEIGLENLVNMTDGGLGGDTLSNHPNIDEIGKKISEHHKGKNNPNYGKGYYYWWVHKYGKETADKMNEDFTKRKSEILKGKKLPPRPDVKGDLNPAKRDEIRNKISEFAKNRVRKKVACPHCGFETVDTHISRHIKSKHSHV